MRILVSVLMNTITALPDMIPSLRKLIALPLRDGTSRAAVIHMTRGLIVILKEIQSMSIGLTSKVVVIRIIRHKAIIIIQEALAFPIRQIITMHRHLQNPDMPVRSPTHAVIRASHLIRAIPTLPAITEVMAMRAVPIKSEIQIITAPTMTMIITSLANKIMIAILPVEIQMIIPILLIKGNTSLTSSKEAILLTIPIDSRLVKGAGETTETAARTIVSSHSEIMILGNKKASV
jgi:hypothetical protein